MNPSCTIFIPTIGRPKYFGPALASAAAQTYQPLNILVSDNASDPPVTAAEVEKWAPEANVRLVRRPQRLEAEVHANLNLREAEGEFIFGLSDDDLISPGYIEAAMGCFRKDPAVKVVVSRQTQIDEEFLGPVSNAPITGSIVAGSDYVTQWFTSGAGGVLTMSSQLARREDMLNCGGVANYPNGANSDNMMLFRLCLGAKLGLLDGGYYYRVYPRSTGLAMPWRDLVRALAMSEVDMLRLHKEGRLEKPLLLAMIRSGTHLLVNRWRTLYRHRPGAANKVRPPLDILLRQCQVARRYGLGAVPLVRRIAGP